MADMDNRGILLLVSTAALAATAIAAAPPPTETTVTRTTAIASTSHWAGMGAAGTARRDAPAVAARAAYVIDASTGTALYEKQAARRMPVASLAKVMTAYVVLKEADLGDVVTITAADVRHAIVNGATSAGLRKGERFTVRDLLYGAMLPSGADATHALARRYGPGNAAFVAKMNAAARSLGLADTRYTNADGLPSPGGGGHSTAEDQVRLAETVLRDPVFRQISSTRRHTVPRTAVHRAHTFRNTNKLLGEGTGVLGVKTGYTRAAGYCLLFAAERDDRLLVGVVLGDPQSARRFSTAGRLLEYAAETASESALLTVRDRAHIFRKVY
ncbi:D-alanyl-D-alanine carboxypeptidase [Spongiactinospora gelatinilytica]|uniref:D-alanyl-D-alanine carboxypeptidase n=1 Tax=Spongiactinospora gelatinilytica TaxID=2666298 RepID=A0A2W2F229_9ACTN|nr:D-alanyl-D-alanine carboxypeptidase family protein [Spongiactinospora gelatinilytica]PZG19850.1 D-alanyl-D-alanine carboxypeptidase [Spongiactinospora gelatinilytica]